MRNRSQPTIPLLLVAVGTLFACMSVRVEIDYDPEADFSALRTYAWMESKPTGDPRIDNDLLHQRVRRAADAQLAAKGFTKDAAAPDFLVIEHFVIEKEIDVDSYVSSYGYRRGPIFTDTYVRQFDVGTVIVDIVDAGTRRLLWRGSGEGRLYENMPPEERSERVNTVVGRMMASFPPG